MKIDINNSPKFIPPISHEDRIFKMQRKMNILAKIHIEKIKDKIKGKEIHILSDKIQFI